MTHETLDQRVHQTLDRLRQHFPKRALVAYPDAIEWPDRLRTNVEACVVVQALLCLFRDVKAFVIESARFHGFDLQRSYGLDPRALWRLDTSAANTSLVMDSLKRDHQHKRDSLGRLVQCVEAIAQDRLLGRDPGKMAYVHEATGFALGRLLPAVESGFCDAADTVVELRRASLELLRRQLHRQDAKSRKKTALEAMIRRIRDEISLEDIFHYHILRYAKYFPRGTPNVDRLCQVYGDELADEWEQLRTSQEDSPLPGEINELDADDQTFRIRMAPRDRSFLFLGDLFGDCTALRARQQVDVEIANIHETVYAWMLDPYYCVWQICSGRQPLLKAHLAPVLTFDGTALFIDAIEAVPKLRDELRGKPNPHLSHRFFRRRRELLETLLEAARGMGERLHVDRVYVDRFSNARWIRDELNRLDTDFYDAREIALPFGTEPIHKLVTEWQGRPTGKIFEEIQAMNLALMDQGLYGTNKETSLLWGRRSESRALSGP